MLTLFWSDIKVYGFIRLNRHLPGKKFKWLYRKFCGGDLNARAGAQFGQKKIIIILCLHYQVKLSDSRTLI